MPYQGKNQHRRPRLEEGERRDNDYIASIKRLIGKEVEVGILDSKFDGILEAANYNPLNVVLSIDGKTVIIKGPLYVREI